jgi:thiol-disulfide isomerase/thioredoxin
VLVRTPRELLIVLAVPTTFATPTMPAMQRNHLFVMSSMLVAAVVAGPNGWSDGSDAFAQPAGTDSVQATPPVAAAIDSGGLLVSMRQAIEAASALSYDAVVYGVGTLENSVPRSESRVWLARLQGEQRGTWRIALAAEAVRIGFDGLDARSIREKESVVVEKTPTDTEDLAVFFSTQSVRHAVAWEMLVAQPFPASIADVTIEGKATVDGVECTVMVMPPWKEIEATAPKGLAVYVGPDALPRRIDRRFEGGARAIELRSFKANSEALSGEFSLVVPEGYRVRAAESNKSKKAPPVQSPETGLLAIGTDAPEWELRDADGKVHKLSDYKGKLVLMDFWATWCGPCKLAMPGVQRLHEAHKEHLVVFGINFAESGDPKAYMEKKGFTYGLLLKAETVAQEYKVSGIPAFYLIDTEGKVLYAATGYNSGTERQLEAQIKAALSK